MGDGPASLSPGLAFEQCVPPPVLVGEYPDDLSPLPDRSKRGSPPGEGGWTGQGFSEASDIQARAWRLRSLWHDNGFDWAAPQVTRYQPPSPHISKTNSSFRTLFPGELRVP